jgi:hypothetical protein
VYDRVENGWPLSQIAHSHKRIDGIVHRNIDPLIVVGDGLSNEYQRGEAGYHIRDLMREMAGLPFCREWKLSARGLQIGCFNIPSVAGKDSFNIAPDSFESRSEMDPV